MIHNLTGDSLKFSMTYKFTYGGHLANQYDNDIYLYDFMATNY